MRNRKMRFEREGLQGGRFRKEIVCFKVSNIVVEKRTYFSYDK